MKYDFPIVMKILPGSQPYAVTIPDLDNLVIDLSSDSDQRLAETVGINFLLEHKILEVLTEKDEAKEVIPKPKTIAEHRKMLRLSANEMWGSVGVEFTSKNKSQCCRNYFPPVIKTLLFLNILAQTVLELGALELTEDKFPNLDEDTSRGITITQTLLSTGFKLAKTFLGPETLFLTALADLLDDYIHVLKQKMYLTESADSSEPAHNLPCHRQLLMKLSIAAVLILAANQLFIGANKSYIELNSLSDKIALDPDGIFSPKLLSAVALTVFILTQLLEPLSLVKFLQQMFGSVENYFRKDQQPKASSQLEVIVLDEEKSETHSGLLKNESDLQDSQESVLRFSMFNIGRPRAQTGGVIELNELKSGSYARI